MGRAAVIGALVLTLVAAFAGCADDGGESGEQTSQSYNEALHDELVAMMRRDVAARRGGEDPEGDAARTERLKQIIEEYGWPTFDLVGRDGANAAWLIAQHSDLDPQFQESALELIKEAAANGQASPGNVAYLTDRVAVGKGEPQTYGTQITCKGPKAKPATPIRNRANVDVRRKRAGLDPLADYFAEMDKLCGREPGVS